MNNTICYLFPSGKSLDEYFIEEQDFSIATTPCSSLASNKNGDPFPKKKIIDSIEDLPDEKWRPIDKKGKYFVSSLGRIKSYHGVKARLLKPYLNQYGYLRVDICLSKRYTFSVHRLVAYAFVENDNPQKQDTIDHIDGNKSNNQASNLRWLSREDNVRAYYSRKKEGEKNEAST